MRVVFAAPSANSALWASLNRATHRRPRPESPVDARFDNVLSARQAMQRRPDRFAYLDTATLASPNAPTSDPFKIRYALAHGAAPWAAYDSDPVMDVRTRASAAQVILQRLTAHGGVREQIAALPVDVLRRVPDPLLREVAARLEETAELARDLRADPIFRLEA